MHLPGSPVSLALFDIDRVSIDEKKWCFKSLKTEYSFFDMKYHSLQLLDDLAGLPMDNNLKMLEQVLDLLKELF